MIRTVFIDANILIAGSGSRKGASRAVLGLAEYGMIQLIVTRQILDETERNIRAKLPKVLPVLSELLLHLNLQILPDPEPEQFERWLSIFEAKDAPILEAAVQVAPDFFLTLNHKDFTPDVALATGLLIQSPSKFVQHIRQLLSQ